MGIDFIVDTNYEVNGKTIAALEFQELHKKQDQAKGMRDLYLNDGMSEEEANNQDMVKHLMQDGKVQEMNLGKIGELLNLIPKETVDKYKDYFGWINYPIEEEFENYLEEQVRNALDKNYGRMFFKFIFSAGFTGEHIKNLRAETSFEYIKNKVAAKFELPDGKLSTNQVLEAMFAVSEIDTLRQLVTLLMSRILVQSNEEDDLASTIERAYKNPSDRKTILKLSLPENVSGHADQLIRYYKVLHTGFMLDCKVLVDF